MSIRKEIADFTGWDDFLVTLTMVVLSILISVSLHFLAFRYLRRLDRKYAYKSIGVIRHKAKLSTLLLVIVTVLLISLPAFQFAEKLHENIKHVFTIILILNIGWLAIVAIDVFENLIIRYYDVNQTNNLRARKVSTQVKVFERILIVFVVVITVSAVLMTFESIRQLGTSLLASAGIISLIVGVAAQKSLSNILAGIQIAITQPIRLDDVVIVEGEWGRIEEITLTYVVVKIWDKRRLIVPITYFIEKPFQNWTRVSADLLGTVYIYTDYTVDFEALRKELTLILESTDLWDGQVNVLQTTNATEKTVEVRALMSAADSSVAWDLRVLVREKLIEFLQKNYPESLPRSRVTIDKEEAPAKKQSASEKE